MRNVAQWAELRADERRRFCERVGAAVGHPAGEVVEDLERGRFFGAAEAVEYGLLDEVCRPDADIRSLRGAGPPPVGFRPCASRRRGSRPRRRAAGRRRGRRWQGGTRSSGAPVPRIGPRQPPSPPLSGTTGCSGSSRARRGNDEPMHIFATLARSPDLFRRWMGFGGALLYGSLPSRLCELVILRTAFRFDGFYEWAQHVEMGQARGVSVEEIEAVGGDALAQLDSVKWTPLERARWPRWTRRTTTVRCPTPRGLSWPPTSTTPA